MSAYRHHKYLAAVALLLALLPALGADGAKPEELFPETTIVAIALPDLEAARNAASNSRMGELFAQAEMRDFIDPIVAKIKAAYEENRPFQPALPKLDDVDAGLLKGAVSFCVYSRGANFEPGVIFSMVPKDIKAFEKLLQPVFKGQPIPQDQPFPLPGGEEAPGVLFSQGRVTICKPMAEIALVADRATDAAKRTKETLAAFAPFQTARAALQEPAAWFYANPKAIAEIADEIANRQNGQAVAKKLLTAFGLEGMNALMGSLTFAAKEISAEFFVGMPEGGAPGLFNARQIPKELMQIAAENAPFVEAGSFDFARLLPALRELVGALAPDPNAVNKFDDAVVQINATLQFNLQKDLLANIEPAIVMAQTPRETGVPLTFNPGMVGVAKLKDAAAVERCLQNLKNVVDAMVGGNVPAVMIRFAKTQHKGATIYYFNQILQGAYAMCVVKDKLVFGNSVNAVKRGLEQLESGTNVLSNKGFQGAIARASGKAFDPAALPVSFSYSVDNGGGGSELALTMMALTAQTVAVSALSQALQTGKQLDAIPQDLMALANIPGLANELGKPAVRTAFSVLNAVDLNLWPDEEFFARYRGSHVAVTMRTKNGWHARSDLPPPMPVMNGGGALVPIALVAVGAAVALPALGQARGAARAVAVSGSLRQVGIGMLNYANANGDSLPNKPEDLYPVYINEIRLFQSPNLTADEDVHYYMLPGLKTADGALLIAAYENSSPAKKRSVLFADGHTETLEEGAFTATLDQTARALKASGRKFEPVPISIKGLMAKKKQ